MAFKKPSTSESNVTSGNFPNKAAAFLNIGVKMADGTERKIGSIPFYPEGNKKENHIQKMLIEKGSIDGLELVLDLNVLEEEAPELAFAIAGDNTPELVEELKQAQ